MFIQLCATATHVKFQVQWRFHKIGACQSCSTGESGVFGGLDIILILLIIWIMITLDITMSMVIHKVTFTHTFNVKKVQVMI